MANISSISELLSLRAQSDSQNHGYTFLTDGEVEKQFYSFRELDKRAKRIGAWLQDSGFAGKQVLLLFPPGLEFVAAFFGCLYAQAVAVPAYPPHANKHSMRIQAIVKDADVELALTTSSLLAKLTSQKMLTSNLNNLRFQTTDTISDERELFLKILKADGGTLAFLQYTSGSTGFPKGVKISHNNLIHNQQMIQQAFAHSENTVFVGWLPLFHDMGLVGNILQPLWLGIPCILMSPIAFLQKPIRWLQAISKYKATTSGGPNFAYDLCVRTISSQQQETLNLSSWDLAFNGAEPIRAKTIEQFAKKFEPQGFRRSSFTPCYGLAEGTLLVASVEKTQKPTVLAIQNKELQDNVVIVSKDALAETYPIVSSGLPCPDGKVAIIHHETGMPCKDGEIGEIWIQGPHVAQGYWNKPETSREVFQADIKNTGQGPYLRSGDLGFLKDENLYVTGRLKDLIIIRGKNYYPQDIEETVIQSHPAFRPGGGGAFSIEINGEEQLALVQEVERVHLQTINVDEMIELIRQQVAENHDLQVHHVVLLKPGSIPKTSSGKIQHQECRKQLFLEKWAVVGFYRHQPEAQGSEDNFEENLKIHHLARYSQSDLQKDLEEFLVKRLSYWLKIPTKNFDVEETFAHYGLDSSIAISLAGELGNCLQTSLDPSLLFDYPNIRSVSKYLSVEYGLEKKNSETTPKSNEVFDK